MNYSFRVILILIALMLQTPFLFADWGEKIERLKPTVVNLDVRCQIPLGDDTPGQWSGTGFIVDAGKGIIATNRHVTSTSPVQITIRFIDGSVTAGRVIYYDYYHDFAFIQFDTSAVGLTLQEVTLGSSFDLRPQQEVLLIGNNDGEEYSVKLGRVVNTVVDKGNRHSATLHTSFDRTGGSSGSPVWNEKEEVIGIHFAGTDTTSFELRIEYLKDALAALRREETPKRGDIGVGLGLMPVSSAIHHYGIEKKFLPNSTKVIYVHTLIPHSPAYGTLRVGDVILSLEDQIVGDNLYLFDKIVDEKVNQKIRVTVLRRHGEATFELPVSDLEKQKTKRFVLLSGGIFQDMTTEIRSIFNYPGDGVFMSHADTGSPFDLGSTRQSRPPTSRSIVIKEIDGHRIRNLGEFIEVVRKYTGAQQTSVVAQDLIDIYTGERTQTMVLDPTYSPLRLFQFAESAKIWLEITEIPEESKTAELRKFY